VTRPSAPTSRIPAIGWICLPCRLALAALFLFAGTLKLQTPGKFAEALMGFKIVPDHLVNFLVFATPWIELTAGALLLIGLWSRAAALVIVGMLATFLAAIVSIIARGIDTQCSCFGDLEIGCTGPVGWCQIIRNTILIALGAVVILWGPGPFAIDKASKA
jgi:putative oxidoreductase